MTRSWPTPAQLSLAAAVVCALALPSTTSAQAAARLAAPGTARFGPTLGQELGDPARAIAIEPAGAPAIPDWTFDLSAVTSLPLSVGLEANVQSRTGLSAQLSVGHTPSAYLGVMAAILRDAGVYRAHLDPIVNEATGSGAWNVRLGVGYTIPEGLEIGVGYTMLTGSSAITPRAIEAATSQRFPWPTMSEVPLSLTTHAIHARLGWRFVFEEHFVARLSIGWTHSFATDARLDVPEDLRRMPDDPATKIETAVREGFGRYGFTPEVLVSAGYRF